MRHIKRGANSGLESRSADRGLTSPSLAIHPEAGIAAADNSSEVRGSQDVPLPPCPENPKPQKPEWASGAWRRRESPAGGPYRPRWSRGTAGPLFDSIRIRSARTLRVYASARADVATRLVGGPPNPAASSFAGPETKTARPPFGAGPFHGGGGSRTRVREPIHQSVYVRIALLCSLPVPARARPFRASCLVFSSSMRQASPSDQPEFASSTRVASGGLLRERTAAKEEPYAAIARLSLAVVLSSRRICEVPGPRHAASTSPNTSKPWRPLLETAPDRTARRVRSSSRGSSVPVASIAGNLDQFDEDTSGTAGVEERDGVPRRPGSRAVIDRLEPLCFERCDGLRKGPDLEGYMM